MRYLPVIFIMLIYSTFSIAQISPIPEVGSEWRQASFGMFGITSLDPFVYNAEENISINDTIYTKIGEGYFREENDIWYVKSHIDSTEHLLFDFNLETGDTLFMFNPFIQEFNDFLIAEYAIVQSTEIVEMLNGDSRKKLNFISYSFTEEGDELAEEESIIAGVGSIESLFYFGFLGEQLDYESNQLVCFHDPDGLVYEEPVSGVFGSGFDPIEYSECDWSVGVLDYDDTNIFKIFPNPVRSKLNIQGSKLTGSKINVQILNANGQTVKKFDNYPATLQVDLSDLTSGMYMIQLTNDSCDQKSLLIVK